MKKTLQLFVALMVTATITAQDFTVDDINYSVLDGTNVTVTGSALAAVVIPSTVDDSGTTYTVTQIAGSAFQNSTTIRSVVTPSTMTAFGGNNAFRSSSITTADFSASTFTDLPNLTFRLAALETIILPASCDFIGFNTFRQCTNLTSFTVLNATPATLDNALFSFNSNVSPDDGGDGDAGTNLFNATLNVPSGEVPTYRNNEFWGRIFGTITDGTVTDVLSTSSAELESAFSLFPNPTNGVVSIKNAQVIDATVTVYDLNGRALLNKNLDRTESEINISNLSNGLYIFRVQSENGEFVKRILKQ
ncbi:T9SS type A sorting domain-containing protein [Algibacter sp. AS12]|uniref:T9SS type A sorting domain-containing protein n=1 Tax=Algibacter sp. AS12 TaxID=3135773 RepID=UPI00398ADB35